MTHCPSVGHNGPDRPSEYSRRRTLVLGLVLAVTYLAGVVASALTPILLANLPAVLLLFNARLSTLLLVQPEMSRPEFYVCSFVGLTIPYAIAYLLGLRVGASVTGWIVKLMPGTGRGLLLIESLMSRSRGLVLVLVPGYLVSGLAGASGVKRQTYASLVVIGAVIRIAAAAFAQHLLDSELKSLDRWVTRFTLPLSAVTATAVAIDLYLGHRWRKT